MKAEYVTSCVNVPMSRVDDLHSMIDSARDITYDTFARRCNWRGIARALGYAVGPSRDLHLKDDWHVSYHRSTFRGKPCYYLRHSAIEYIFQQEPS